MPDLVLKLRPETKKRLSTVAAKMGRSEEECAETALKEFLDNWDDHIRSMAEISGEEDRPMLGMKAAKAPVKPVAKPVAKPAAKTTKKKKK